MNKQLRGRKIMWMVIRLISFLLSFLIIVSLFLSFGLIDDFGAKTILILPSYYAFLTFIYFVQSLLNNYFGYRKLFIRLIDVSFLFHLLSLYIMLFQYLISVYM